MAQTPQGMDQFEAEVISADGPCSAGHQVGDKLLISCWDTGGLCGYFYHDIFPSLSVIQFGGRFPWGQPGQLEMRCCDKGVNLTLVIRKK
jgi:uncharacterized repeat protein (TIGR04076 family)